MMRGNQGAPTGAQDEDALDLAALIAALGPEELEASVQLQRFLDLQYELQRAGIATGDRTGATEEGSSAAGGIEMSGRWPGRPGNAVAEGEGRALSNAPEPLDLDAGTVLAVDVPSRWQWRDDGENDDDGDNFSRYRLGGKHKQQRPHVMPDTPRIAGRLYITITMYRAATTAATVTMPETVEATPLSPSSLQGRFYAVISFQGSTQRCPLRNGDIEQSQVLMFDYAAKNGATLLTCSIYKRRLLARDTCVASCTIAVRDMIKQQDNAWDQGGAGVEYDEYWGFVNSVRCMKDGQVFATICGRLVDLDACSALRNVATPAKCRVTELHRACLHGKSDILADLIYTLALYQRLSDCINVSGTIHMDHQPFDDVSALDVALMFGHKDCARVILERAAMMCAKRFAGTKERSIFHCAAVGGHEVVVLLLQFLHRYGDKTVEYVTPKMLIDAQEVVSHRSPIMIACMRGDNASVKHLIKAGCSIGNATGKGFPLIIDSHDGKCLPADYLGGNWTPLMYAAAGGHVDIVKTLLRCINKDIPSTTDSKQPFVSSALAHLTCAPLARTSSGCNVVIIAAACNRLDILRELRKASVPLSIRNAKTGDTALHVAAACGHLDICKYFITEEALEWGSTYGDQSLRKELFGMSRLSVLDRQIGVSIYDSSVASVAAHRRRFEASVLFHLFPKSKMLRSINSDSLTPADTARRSQHLSLEEMLRSADAEIYPKIEPGAHEPSHCGPASDEAAHSEADAPTSAPQHAYDYDYDCDHDQYVMALVPSQKLPLWRPPELVK